MPIEFQIDTTFSSSFILEKFISQSIKREKDQLEIIGPSHDPTKKFIDSRRILENSTG